MLVYEGGPFVKLENPRYDYDGVAILVDAWLREFPDEKVSYCLREDDCTEYAKYYYNEITNGALGEVGQLVVTDEDLKHDIAYKRLQLLYETDWTQLPDVPQETQQLWKAYRQALRDITEQEGYPREVVWPEKPKETI